ncbi:MAG: hypothetical protein KAJ46_02330 [Sedimentisphaerales bacterium]|nr:hypothetical protein [Sedimentisphaerales bacterium]
MAKVNPLFWTIQMCIPFMGLVIFDVTTKSLKSVAKTDYLSVRQYRPRSKIKWAKNF